MRCAIHSNVPSTGRCRRCMGLFCEECLLDSGRSPLCRSCGLYSASPRVRGIPLLLLLLLPPIVAPIGFVAYDELVGAPWERNEEAAARTLRTIASVQAQFREGDRDNDNILDYATALSELSTAGLIDNVLGQGVKSGYSFGLSGSTFDWLATATPVSTSTGTRNFMICTDGVVRFSSSGSATCNDRGWGQ